MGKIPYMKFYCQDWLKDSQLRLCSAATRGIFIDMLAMMHDFEKRGYLAIVEKANGKLIESKLKAKQIARLIGEDSSEVETALEELLRYNVLKTDAEGFFYSKRMVEESEISKARSANGKQGGRGNKKDSTKSKTKANQKQNPEYEYEDENVNDNIIKKGVENNSTQHPLDYEPLNFKTSKYPFTDFWELYGVNKTEFQAGRQWTYLDDDERKRAMEHVPKYLEYCKATKTRVLYPVNYLQDKRYNDEIEQSKEITIDDF